MHSLTVDQVLTTEGTEIFMDDMNIVHVTYTKAGHILTGEETVEIFEKRTSLGAPREKQLVLFDIRNSPKPDRSSKEFGRTGLTKEHTHAMALLVNSALGKFLGNLTIGYFKKDFPVKLFTTEGDATAWLLSQRNL